MAGEVDVGAGRPMAGPASAVLFCCARPLSDVEIAPRRIERVELAARNVLTAMVFRLAQPAPDVWLLHLRFPAGVRARFRAGQYLQVLLEDGERRNFSMANSPLDRDGVQLHVRHVPGGRFSEDTLARLQPGHELRVELPFGDFFLREDSDKPIIFVATGTGFAPIKAMVEDALRRGQRRPMCLYWGARRPDDLYLADLPAHWAARHPFFTFVPVVSRPAANWQGRTGRTPQAVLEDHPSLAGHQVYACGDPLMIATARRDFVTLGRLPPRELYCDAFVSAAEPP